jgi:hypothetical protein
MVPKVNEQQVSMITLAVNPARQTDCLTNVFCAQSATGMGAIKMHDVFSFAFKKDFSVLF